MKNHPWTGKSHDRSNFLPHLRLVAMHPAVGAKSFCLHEGASVTALAGVVPQSGAVRAEHPMRMVPLLAVQSNHLRHHSFFPLPLGVGHLCHQLILPFSTEYTVSAISIVDCLWDTSTTVFPFRASWRDLRITASFRLSRLLVGSSSRRKGAS